MDRLDYVSMMCNDMPMYRDRAPVGIDPPERAQYIRVMFDEIRAYESLMWLGAHGLDIGAMTVFLLCFKEREELMDVYGRFRHAHACHLLPPRRRAPRSADAMPKYQASRWRSQKEAARMNEARSGTMLDFIQAFTVRFRPPSTTTRRCSRQPHLKQRTSTSGWYPRSAPCSWASPPDAARLRHCLGPAQEAAYECTTHGFRCAART